MLTTLLHYIWISCNSSSLETSKNEIRDQNKKWNLILLMLNLIKRKKNTQDEKKIERHTALKKIHIHIKTN